MLIQQVFDRHRILFLLLLWAALHTTLYNLIVPLWQAPDEPAHVEYACLLSQRGWDLRPGDYDPALQRYLIQSLAASDFWRHVRQPVPEPLPAQFSDDPFLRNAGRQVGDEFPLYYLVPALICRLPLTLLVQVHLMRLVSGLFFVLAVLATWWAGGAIWPEQQSPIIGVTAAMAGLPMLAFLSGGVSNDSLVTLLGTVTFGLLARWVSPGLPRADRKQLHIAAGVLLCALLAVVAKKTAAFLVPLASLAVAWSLYQGWHCWSWRRRAMIGLPLLFLVALFFWPSGQPWAWIGRGQPWGGGRLPAAAHSGRFGVRVVDTSPHRFGRLVQVVPAEVLPQLRGQTVRFGVWVRTDQPPQPLRVTVKDDEGVSQSFAEATDAWQWVEVTHTVSLTSEEVRVGVAPGRGDSVSEMGTIDVDDAALIIVAGGSRGGNQQGGGGNLLRNGDFERGTAWGSLLLGPLVQPLVATWQGEAHGPAVSWQRRLLYLILLFPGFWGNFGWLQVPLPLPVYGLLAIVCGWAFVGLLLAGHDHLPSGVARWFAIGLVLALAQVLAPMWGRDWQPQARYLFPALLPTMTFLVAGLQVWSRRWRFRYALPAFVGGFLLLDGIALFGVLIPHYYYY